MTQDELDKAIAAVNAEADNALTTLGKVATQAVFSKKHLIEGLQAILAILNESGPEPATSVEFIAGAPREQPKP
jgi:hypothetical protein